MSKSVVRGSGAPIGEQIDPATRQQLENLRDDLKKAEVKQALDRPRGTDGRYTEVPRDQLVRDNKTLQRMRDVTASVGDQTVGWLLDQAKVPSVTQLTKRYSTQASRAPLLGVIAGNKITPATAAVLGTCAKMGDGAKLEAEPTPEVDATQSEPRAEQTQSGQPRWLSSLVDFGKMVVGKAEKAWSQLKTHPRVAPILSFFVGKGFGPAHGAVAGANPPSAPTKGAPIQTPEPEVIDPAADLSGAVANLGSLWPKGVDTAPEGFDAQAAALQDYKTSVRGGFGAWPAPSAVSTLLDACDLMHGKPNHSQNLSRLASAFLGDSEVKATLRSADGFSTRLGDQVMAAAPWLNLGDIETPVSVLAAKRRLTDDERAEHIDTRPAKAGAQYMDLALGGNKTAELIAAHRSPGAERPLAHQLLCLLDDTAALAAKPFCRTETGVDAKVLAKELTKNAKRGSFDPALAKLMVGAAERGLVDSAISIARPDDLFVK